MFARPKVGPNGADDDRGYGSLFDFGLRRQFFEQRPRQRQPDSAESGGHDGSVIIG